METYSVNIAKANKNDDFAKFLFHHEFTQEYGLKDLSPSSIFGLTQEFKTNPKKADTYLRNKSLHGPAGLAEANG